MCNVTHSFIELAVLSQCCPSMVSAPEIMSEFRIHHDVNELLGLLNVRGGDGAEVYIDLLQKNRTGYVTTTVSAHSAKVNRDDAFHFKLVHF